MIKENREEINKLISERTKKAMENPLVRRRCSIAQKLKWKDENFRKACIEKRVKTMALKKKIREEQNESK